MYKFTHNDNSLITCSSGLVSGVCFNMNRDMAPVYIMGNIRTDLKRNTKLGLAGSIIFNSIVNSSNIISKLTIETFYALHTLKNIEIIDYSSIPKLDTPGKQYTFICSGIYIQ